MTAHISRPKVLIIAEAANPEWVSVPLIGWSLSRALAEVADVHIVTQIRNRPAFLRAGLVEDVDFTAIDSEAVAKPLYTLGTKLAGDARLGWTIQQAAAALGYPYFEHLIWKKFGPDLRAGVYDLVHRVTPLSPVQQSPIAAKLRRIGVPFVVGPINGGVPWPKGFESEMRREREWLSKLRAAYRLLPGRRSTLRADALLVGSRDTMRDIPLAHRDRAIHMPENAIDPARFNRTADHAAALAGGPLRGCFIGRLVPYKGADMLIEAAAPLLALGRMEIDIIGDGPMMESLRAQAAPFGDRVRLHGWVAHDRVQDIAANCTALTFPSIREFGGGVVLEAMALGLCPIVVGYAGPKELVTDPSGFRVPIGNRAQIVAELGALLNYCADNPEVVAKKAKIAQNRVTSLFTWSAKSRQISQIYRWVLDNQTAKPDFHFDDPGG